MLPWGKGLVRMGAENRRPHAAYADPAVETIVLLPEGMPKMSSPEQTLSRLRG